MVIFFIHGLAHTPVHQAIPHSITERERLLKSQHPIRALGLQAHHACVILDGLGEHLLLGVEVVVGEPRSHTSCTRYSLLLDILLSDMWFQALQEYTKANI